MMKTLMYLQLMYVDEMGERYSPFPQWSTSGQQRVETLCYKILSHWIERLPLS